MKIETILRENSKKVTLERVQLFEFMETKHLFTTNNIIDFFPTIGRASIFRTVKLFQEIGVLRRINLGNNSESYEIECCKKHHHEHMKCISCGTVLNFQSQNICKKLFSEAKKLGFQISEHSIAISGTCKNCC